MQRLVYTSYPRSHPVTLPINTQGSPLTTGSYPSKVVTWCSVGWDYHLELHSYSSLLETLFTWKLLLRVWGIMQPYIQPTFISKRVPDDPLVPRYVQLQLLTESIWEVKPINVSAQCPLSAYRRPKHNILVTSLTSESDVICCMFIYGYKWRSFCSTKVVIN